MLYHELRLQRAEGRLAAFSKGACPKCRRWPTCRLATGEPRPDDPWHETGGVCPACGRRPSLTIALTPEAYDAV